MNNNVLSENDGGGRFEHFGKTSVSQNSGDAMDKDEYDDLSDECLLDPDSDDAVVDDHEGASDKNFDSSEELDSDDSEDLMNGISPRQKKCGGGGDGEKSQKRATVVSSDSEEDEEDDDDEVEGRLMQEAKDVKVLSSEEDSDGDMPLSAFTNEKNESESGVAASEAGNSMDSNLPSEAKPVEIDWSEAAERLLAEAAADEEKQKEGSVSQDIIKPDDAGKSANVGNSADVGKLDSGAKSSDTLPNSADSDSKLPDPGGGCTAEQPGDTKDDAKDDTKGETKDDMKGETKDDTKGESKDDKKDEKEGGIVEKPKKKRKRKASGEGASKKAKKSEDGEEEDGKEQGEAPKKKKPKKKQVKNEGDGEEAPEEGEKKKKKKKKKPKDDEEASEGDGEEKEKKKKRKRKKKKSESGDEEDKAEKKRKAAYERRNIRKLLSEEDVDVETLNAQKEEMERKKRLQETQQRFLQEQEREREREIERTCSELKSLLEEPLEQIDDEEAEESPPAAIITQMPVMSIKTEKTEEIDDIEEEMDVEKKEKKEDVIELSSSEEEEDNDVMVLPSEPEEESDEEDPNNSGSHVNDALNLPDMDGNVLVNVGHPEKERDIFLAPQLSAYVKPHQIGGIRFLYDNLVESLDRYKSSNGFGCILAHSMGLGKTVQVIGFIDIFLRYTGAKTVLVIVPVNTLQNWLHEFNMWLPDAKQLLEEERKKKEAEDQVKEKERLDKEKKEKAERDKAARAEREKERAARRKNSNNSGGPGVGGLSSDPYTFPGMDMPPGMHNGPNSYLNSGYPGYPGASQGWPGGPNGPPGYMGSGRHYGYPGHHMGNNPYAYPGSMPGMQGGYPMPYPGGMHGNYNGGYMDRGYSGMHGQCGDLPGYPGMGGPPPGYPQPFGSGFPGQPGMMPGDSNYPPTSVPNCNPNFPSSGGPGSFSSNMNYPPTTSSSSSGFPPGYNYPMTSSSGSSNFPNPSNSMDSSQGSFSHNSNSSDFLSNTLGNNSSSATNSSQNNTSDPVTTSASKVNEPRDFVDQLLDGKSDKSDEKLLEGKKEGKSTEEKPVHEPESKAESKPEVKPEKSDEADKPSEKKEEKPVSEQNGEAGSSGSKSPKEESEKKEEGDKEKSEKKEVKEEDVKKEGEDDKEEKEVKKEDEEEDYDTLWPGLRPRKFGLYIVNDAQKTPAARAKVVGEWYDKGGALLMGYEMYRLLTSKRAQAPKKKSKKEAKKDAAPEVIDVEEEDKNKELALGMYDQLVKPGPDLIICDEGHRIKNSHASISQALKNIRTKRRVVLTGYPLQNNLLEYWCMVDFVRPNFLGSKTEFCNMFERPIMNGQCVDSTPQDVKLMRFRSHVLHSLLEGFVQRRGHTVLQKSLPEKEEYVFLVKMSPIQSQLYSKFMESIKSSGLTAWASNNPIKAFSVCCKIWNHPDTLHQIVEQRKNDDDDLDLDPDSSENNSKKKNKRSKAVVNPSSKTANASTSGTASAPSTNPPTPTGVGVPSASGTTTPSIAEDSVSSPASLSTSMSATDLAGSAAPSPSSNPPATPQSVSLQNPAGQEEPPPNPLLDKKTEQISYEWAYDLMKDYKKGVEEHGPKIVLLMSLVEETLKVGDKMLIFSQSLYTLNLIEYFLGQREIPVPEREGEKWAKNKSYFRLDGSTSASEREKLINAYNDPESRILLFLLSTRAGCLGINLVGANRVVVIDASWNPCHDCQAVCRVYRYGQTKKCYIYRFVTDNCMERRIYDRQINKQGISDRVVDELSPEMHFTRTQVEKLMDYEEKDLPHIEPDCAKDVEDTVLKKVISDHYQWITRNPFTHESLLIDRKDQKLTKTEKKLAKQGYEMEKRLSINYSRPSYSAFYPKNMNPMDPPRFPPPRVTVINPGGPNRPIASVRPMISTPLPGMQGRGGNLPISSLLRPGVSVHQVQTTTDIVIPGTATATQSGSSSGSRIPAGETVLVIKTPKGVYIRTNQGKIFAVRTAPKAADASAKTTQSPSNSSTLTTTMPKAIAGINNVGTKTVTVVTPSGGLPPGTRPIIISSQGRYAQLIKSSKDQLIATSSLKPGQPPTLVRVVQNTSKLLEQAKKDAERRSGRVVFVKDIPDSMKKINIDALKLASMEASAKKVRLKDSSSLEKKDAKEKDESKSKESDKSKEGAESTGGSESEENAEKMEVGVKTKGVVGGNKDNGAEKEADGAKDAVQMPLGANNEEISNPTVTKFDNQNTTKQNQENNLKTSDDGGSSESKKEAESGASKSAEEQKSKSEAQRQVPEKDNRGKNNEKESRNRNSEQPVSSEPSTPKNLSPEKPPQDFTQKTTPPISKPSLDQTQSQPMSSNLSSSHVTSSYNAPHYSHPHYGPPSQFGPPGQGMPGSGHMMPGQGPPPSSHRPPPSSHGPPPSSHGPSSGQNQPMPGPGQYMQSPSKSRMEPNPYISGPPHMASGSGQYPPGPGQIPSSKGQPPASSHLPHGQGYPGSSQAPSGPGQGYPGGGQGPPGPAQGYPGSSQGPPGPGQGYSGQNQPPTGPGQGPTGQGFPGSQGPPGHSQTSAGPGPGFPSQSHGPPGQVPPGYPGAEQGLMSSAQGQPSHGGPMGPSRSSGMPPGMSPPHAGMPVSSRSGSSQPPTSTVSGPSQPASGPSSMQPTQRSPMQASPSTQHSPQGPPMPQVRGSQQFPQTTPPQQPPAMPPVQQPLPPPPQRQQSMPHMPMSQQPPHMPPHQPQATPQPPQPSPHQPAPHQPAPHQPAPHQPAPHQPTPLPQPTPQQPPMTQPAPHASQRAPSPKEDKKKKSRKKSKKSKDEPPPQNNSSIEKLKEMSQGLPMNPSVDPLTSMKYPGSEELSRFLPHEPGRFPNSDPLRFGAGDPRSGLFPPEPSKFGAPESSVFGAGGDVASPYMGSSYNSMPHTSQLGSSYGSYSSGLHGSSMSHLGMPPVYGQYPGPAWGYGANVGGPSSMWPHGSMQNSSVYPSQPSSYDSPSSMSYSAAAALRDLDKKLDSSSFSSSANSFLDPLSQSMPSTPSVPQTTASSFDMPGHNPYTPSYSSYPPYHSSYLPPPPSMYMPGSSSYMPPITSTTSSNPYSQSSYGMAHDMPGHSMYPGMPPPDPMLPNNPTPFP